jgi:iron complex outermembrane recepter protein
VIRGPVAAMWGANAVNGVINIITKTATDTAGSLARLDAGSAGAQGAVRYGWNAGPTTYRLYSQWSGRAASELVSGGDANDASQSVTTGFRADATVRPGLLTFEGDFTAGRARALWANLDPQTVLLQPIVDDPSTFQGGHLLGRWVHKRAGGASLQVQSFLDVATRNEPIADYHRAAADVDVQYHSTFGARQDLVVGAGYRFIDESFDGHVGTFLNTNEHNSTLVTGLLQDEIALFGNRMAVTLGAQVQHDSDSGPGVQPTARVMWTALPRQRLWGSVSRALRTPSLSDRWLELEYPPVPSAGGLPLVVRLEGNPDAVTETLVDAEAGYRLEVGASASIDLTGFAGRYAHLPSQEPDAPVVEFVPAPQVRVTSRFANLLDAKTRGLEVAGHWTPMPAWRLDAAYSAFAVTPELADTSRDPSAADTDATAPRHQWQLRTTYAPVPRATLSLAIFHVGALEQFQIAAYTRADLTAEWRVSNRLSLMAVGQNLTDAAHSEFAGAGSLLLATQIPRAVSVRLRWTRR